MRITQAYYRTERNVPGGAGTDSYRLLYRGGFIRPMSAGKYALLPIGLRVQKHILKIIKRELAPLGAEPVRLPVTIPPPSESARDKNEAPSEWADILNDVGDAAAADLFVSIRPSYKDLPLRFFQLLAAPQRADKRQGKLSSGFRIFGSGIAFF